MGVDVDGVVGVALMSVDAPAGAPEVVEPGAPIEVPLPIVLDEEVSVLAVLGGVVVEVSALVVGAVEGAVVVLEVVDSVVVASREQADRVSTEAAIRARARGVDFIRDTPWFRM